MRCTYHAKVIAHFHRSYFAGNLNSQQYWQALESVWKVRADPRFVPDRIRRYGYEYTNCGHHGLEPSAL